MSGKRVVIGPNSMDPGAIQFSEPVASVVGPGSVVLMSPGPYLGASRLTHRAARGQTVSGKLGSLFPKKIGSSNYLSNLPSHFKKINPR